MHLPPMVPLRAVREAYGLTTAQLAQRIREQGVEAHPDHLANVELGYKKASRELVRAWALALKMHPLDIRQADDLAALAAAPDEGPVPVRESA